MKAKYIITPILIILSGATATFFLAPLKAWKKGTIIMSTPAGNWCDHTPAEYDPKTISYWNYCIAWWLYKFEMKSYAKK